MTTTAGTSSITATPRRPLRASIVACASIPGGSHRRTESTVMIVSWLIDQKWMNRRPCTDSANTDATITVMSRPRRELRLAARTVERVRAVAADRSSSRTIAATATRPDPLVTRPSVVPNTTSTTVAGAGPMNDARSSPRMSGTRRNGKSTSRPGSSDSSVPKVSNGRTAHAEGQQRGAHDHDRADRVGVAFGGQCVTEHRSEPTEEQGREAGQQELPATLARGPRPVRQQLQLEAHQRARHRRGPVAHGGGWSGGRSSHPTAPVSASRAPTSSTKTSSRRRPARRSSVAPSAMIRPWSTTATRSQMRSTTSITWLENTTVWPESVKRSSNDRITRVDTGSTASNGSSRNRTDGPCSSAAASADLLAHARAVVDDEGVRRSTQIEHVEQLVGPLGDHGRSHPPQQAAVVEQLGAGEAVEQPELVGQHTDVRLDLDRIGPDVAALDPDTCRRRVASARSSSGSWWSCPRRSGPTSP